MAQQYKIKITKAYHIAIEDKDGYEVASDWSFFDYKETKKIAEKMLADTTRIMDEVSLMSDMSMLEDVSVGKDCHLCGSMFVVGVGSDETICPKCQDMWKELIKSKEVR